MSEAGTKDREVFTPTPGAVKEDFETLRGQFAASLAKAVSSVQNAAKDARNKFHNYDYTSTEGIIVACREALSEQGITLVRVSSFVRFDSDPAMLECEFRAAHVNGYCMRIDIVWPVIPEKGRPFDKAMAASLTSSLGYVLRDLLLVPRQDEKEHMDKRNDKEHDPAALGELGAERVRERLDANGIAVEALVSAIERSGTMLHGSMEKWPRTLLPRIEKWIAVKCEEMAAKLAADSASAAAEYPSPDAETVIYEGGAAAPMDDDGVGDGIFEATPAEKAKAAITKGRKAR